jgi:hypothetical protein
MDDVMFGAFHDELTKIAAGRDIGQLLGSLASRKGLDPSKVPAIKQVGNIASAGNRSRAAEVAGNVRNFLKSAPAGA